MSTMDPTGDGGGGGSSTFVDYNVTPGTPSTDIAVQPGSQHHQHPPPSPLSGCYLLVVLPEPHTAQHRDLILNRLAKGFLSWDKDNCHVDLEKELQALVAQAPEGEEARNGERLIQYATENLVTEVLIHPQTNTLLQCIRNLLASFTKHRHIIHAGYTFGGNGSWILQDGTFSLADFLDAFSEHEVQRVLRAYENSVTVDINCVGVGEWSTCRLSKEACTRSCRVRLNPDDVLTAGVPAIASFTNYVGQYLLPQTLDQLMEPSDVVGNIRFSHPTLYVFPGGQGDAALFGINGFNMLVDGGFARKACFWDFARHLDRLDAVLLTRVNNSNVGGMSSVLRKKREMHVYPQIGHFFCNLVERRHSNSPDGDKDLDPLTLNLIDIGQEMMVDLRQINLRAHPCYRDPNPINLYHKVGHGTLDMYVLSPSKDSREVREFLSKWHSADSKLFAGSHKKDSNNLTFPIQNLASICALLVWQPANPEDTITRILFPGSTPQHKIFEGFERLKHLDFLKHPVCSAKSLSPSTSLLALKDRPTIKQKLGLIEKESKKSLETRREKRDLPESKLSKAAAEDTVSKPTSQTTPIVAIPKAQTPKIDGKTKKVVENKKIETEGKKIEKVLREMLKESTKKDITKMDKDVDTKKSEAMRIKSDTEKVISSKEPKAKYESKKKDTKNSKLGKISKIEIPSKPVAKLLDKKPKSVVDKKDSVKGSPTTPKKCINSLATKVEAASKTMPRPITKPAGKQPPLSMPAKSAKDANNRKVVEQKNIEIASAASAAAPASVKLVTKPKTSERQSISRRTKPVSPSKARVPSSPAKSTRSTPTTSVKSDKDGVIRKVKGDRGTTDSSTVSTPSGIEIDSMTKIAEKNLTEKSEDMSLDSIESKVLADLKEEREVVEEIEAVLQKAERIEEARKDDHLDGDDDITAEATDKKEDDMTEDDVTADIEEAPKKKSSRKVSQELTEEDEYLIVEKEEIYIEDSAQSGEGEQKHALDAVESEKIKPVEEMEAAKEKEEAEASEEKEKSDIPEKKLLDYDEETDKEKEEGEMSPGHKEQLKQEMKDIIASATEIVQRTEDKDDSGKRDSEDITKEPSTLSPDKFDSSEKKTTDTDPMKPEVDQKDQQVAEKLEESQERISTLESGATTTAPTLPEDERIPLDDIKEVIDEKYIVDEDKEKDSIEQVKESFVAPISTEPKPDAKSFQVRPAVQGIQREIVKTPDEVADLPVHEEVDPKLYRMEDFEKAKEEKPSVAPLIQQQEIKESPTPPVKEQKGVFSFFGKVADKFEKGIDKLTGKSRRDSEKDIDEKSSSKSSSPKEAKPQEITPPRDVHDDEVNETFAKPIQITEISEIFEKGEPEFGKVKVAAITDTAAFLHREIEDLTKNTVPDRETKEIIDTVEAAGSDRSETKAESRPVALSDPVFETCVLKGQQKDILISSVAEVEEDAEDVEALLEEASKKFKTVKDSLRDSLESLEDKIVEEEMVRAELAAASKDVVKDTLSEVVEKLEEIQPQQEISLEVAALADTKEPEKVKFDIPKTEDFEDDEHVMDVTKDFKEAVRDVGEVLAGSAGILIEDKPKDVIEIVKKVAEELKRDDFLSHDVLFDKDIPKPIIEEIILKKVGVTEELQSQEEIGEMLESGIATKSEIQEEPCVKSVTSKGIGDTSPIRELTADTIGAMQICSDLMKEEPASSRQEQAIRDECLRESDVMEDGTESICVKQEVKRQTSKDDDETREIEGLDIVFERKLSPDKARIVIVTPDSAPTSPKCPGVKIHTKEEIDETSQLPTDIKNELDKEVPIEQIIENLLFTKKTKITIEIVEYITVIRNVPREKVIYIIEEIIIKKGVPRDSVVADLDLLRSDAASSEKREEIELFIEKEYITKNKKITIDIVEEISQKNFVTKRIVIEIIEEIIIKRSIPRDVILDISDNELSYYGGHRKESIFGQTGVPKTSQVSDGQGDEIPEIDNSSTDVRSEIKKYITNEIISKGKKISSHFIEEISITRHIPRRLFIEMLEELIIKHNIPRSSILDISEKELSGLIMSEKDDFDQDEVISETKKEEEPAHISVTSEARLQIEKNLIDEYVTKNCKITPYIFEKICVQNNVSMCIIIEIIEELVVKHKVPRSSILDISDIELAELLAAEKERVRKESVDAAADDEDKKNLECETEEYEFVATERLSEIENGIFDEFISKSRRITPYIFEDICIRYKIPRRILIEIIEEIIIKRNISRGSILDITDVKLSELLVAAETGSEQDELDVRSIAGQNSMPKDIGEDKLVDGFVSIPGKEVASTKSVSPPTTIELAEQALKECEKDVADDFEAVEQEYKIHGTPIATAKESISIVLGTKSDAENLIDDTEGAFDDDVSDVVEADERIIGAVAPITVAMTTTKKKSENIPKTSEIVDTTEKYLIEGQEKVQSQKHTPVKPLDNLVDGINEAKLKHEQDTDGKSTSQVDTTSRQYPVALQDHQNEVNEREINSQEGLTAAQAIDNTVQLQRDTGTDTEVGKTSTAPLEEELRENKEQESGGKSPVIEDKIDIITRVKRSVDEVSQQQRDSLPIQDHVETVLKSGTKSPENDRTLNVMTDDDEIAVPTSTVRRMLVTASSEDGGQETEVCPSGSITFTKTITPDDSLKSSPVKTTPDQDSLLLDKESLSSRASTPEKDSVSGKSTPETKNDDKITPEDSLDKSPSGIRDSQDIEDSLDKSDLTNIQEVEESKSLTIVAQDIMPSKLSIAADRSNETVQAVIYEKESGLPTMLDNKLPIESTECSRTSTADGDKISEKGLQELIECKLPSMSTEKHDDKTPMEYSKSPSVAGDRLSEKGTSEVDEESRSHRVASKKYGDEERSGSPSVAGDKVSEIDLKYLIDESKSPFVINEKIDDKVPVERSNLSDTAGGKCREAGASEVDEKSRSPSVGGEKHDNTDNAELSRPSSIEDKITGKDKKYNQIDESKLYSDVSENIDKKAPIDRSEIHSITSDKLTKQEDSSEIDKKSRSPSITSEKQDEKECIDPTKSPSIGDSIIGIKESAECSRTSSVAHYNIIDANLKEVDEKSELPIVARKKVDDRVPVDRSKSPTIAGDEHSENNTTEDAEKSRSPSIVSEKHDPGQPSENTRTSSVTGDVITEKDIQELVAESKSPIDVTEQIDDKTTVERLKSPSIADVRYSEITALEVNEKLRSSSIVSEKHDGKESDEQSRSLSVVGDNIAEKDVKAVIDESKSSSDVRKKIEDKAPVDHCKSPSVADDMYSKEGTSDLDDKSQSPIIVSEKDDAKPSDEHPKMPSFASDKNNKEYLKELQDRFKSPNSISEKIDDKAPDERLRSPSITGDRWSENAVPEGDKKSRSPSVASERLDSKESIEHSRSPSITSDKITETYLKDQDDESQFPDTVGERIDDKASVERTKSSSTSNDEYSEKTVPELDEKSRSRIVASERLDRKEPIKHSRSPSITSEKITEMDLKEQDDESKLPDTVSAIIDDKAPAERSKSPSTTDDRYSEKTVPEVDKKSRSPSVASERLDSKEPIEHSRSASITSDKITEMDLKEQDDESKLPDTVSDMIDEKAPAERSKSPSTTDNSEKTAPEADKKSRSPSVASEGLDSKESIEHLRSPSITSDKITEMDSKEQDDESKLPDTVSERIDDKVSVERSKSPSTTGDRCSEKPIVDADGKSRSPSVASKGFDSKESIEHARSPSINSDKIIEMDLKEQDDDKEPMDRSKSLSIAGDRYIEKAASEVDENSRSPSIVSDKHDAMLPSERSRTPSVVIDKITESDLKGVDAESKLPNVVSEEADVTGPVDRSKSPSIAGDRHSEKAASDVDENSRSPSIASDKHDAMLPSEHSRTPSVVGEEVTESDLKEMDDESQLPNVLTEKTNDGAHVDRSKSPSITGDRPSEKAAPDVDENSRSPSIVSDKHDTMLPSECSRTLSVAGDKITKSDLKGVDDESKLPNVVSEKTNDRTIVDHLKSPSIAGDRHSEKVASDIDENARSPSIASDKHDAMLPSERSRTPSVVGDKITESDLKEMDLESKLSNVVTEKTNDRAPVDRSKSPSISGDRLSEKANSDVDENSRSPSFARDKHDAMLPGERSTTPSLAGDKITESDLEGMDDESKLPNVISEKADDRGPVNRSKSPSIASDRLSEKTASEVDKNSRSPSIASEKHDVELPSERSRTPSVADDKMTESDLEGMDDESKLPNVVSKKADDTRPVDRSKSPSIASDRLSEKTASEVDKNSRSPSIASEKHDVKLPSERSRTPSVADDKMTESDLKEMDDEFKLPNVVSEKADDTGPVDRSKSPSIASDRLSEKTASEVDKNSRSPSIASEKHDVELPSERSRTPSVADHKMTESDLKGMDDESKLPNVVSEKADDTGPVDRSKSPSIASDRLSEKTASEVDKNSRSPSIASEKHDVELPSERSRTPSVADDKMTESDLKGMDDESKLPNVVSEKADDTGPVDRSKSPSIASDRLSEKTASEVDKNSRSPSIASEKHDVELPSERLRTPSVADDKMTEWDLKEMDDEFKLPNVVSEKADDTGPVDRSKSPSIASDRLSEKTASEVDKNSRSPSIASEKHDVELPNERSRTPSVADVKMTESDLEGMDDESKLPNVVSEKADDTGPVDRSKSPSIASDRLSEKTASEVDQNLRSSSTASEKHNVELPSERSRTPSVADDKMTESDLKGMDDEYKFPNVVSEKADDTGPVDRSKSPSIANDRLSENTASEVDKNSRSSSIASEKHDVELPSERLRTPGVTGDKMTESDLKVMDDESKLSNVVSGKTDDRGPVDRSKSPRIASDRLSDKTASEVDKNSRSPSIASEKHDVELPSERSRTPSVADDKMTESDLKEMDDESKLPNVVSEKADDTGPVDRSKSPSIASDRLSEKTASEVDKNSRSPSIASEKHDVELPSERSRTPSVADDKMTESDLKEMDDESKLPNVVSEKADDTGPVDRSKSPSIASDRLSEKTASEVDKNSRSPSIASEKHDVELPSERSRTPSVADDKMTESDLKGMDDESKLPNVVSEKADDTGPVDRSKSPSIAGDGHSEKSASEVDEKSRSSTIASEQHGGKELTERSRSPSIIGRKIVEMDLENLVVKPKSTSVDSEQIDDRVPVDQTKIPSIVSNIYSEKDASESGETSRSPSIASEKHDGRQSAIPSETPSIVGDNITEKDVEEVADMTCLPSIASEIMNDKALIDDSKSSSPTDHSRSTSVSSDKITEKDVKELADVSKSPSVVSKQIDDKEPVRDSQSISIISEKDASVEDEKLSSINNEKYDCKETATHSRSSSVTSSKDTELAIREPDDHCRSPTIVGDNVDNKLSVDRLKSPSICDDKDSIKDITEIDGNSQSSSMASVKHNDQELVDGDADITERHLEKSEDQSISFTTLTLSNIAGDEHSKSSKIITVKPDDKSQSPSIADEKYNEKELTVKSRSPSIISDNEDKNNSQSLTIDDDKQEEATGDEHGELDATKQLGKPRLPSVDSKKTSDEAFVDESKLPSTAGDEHSEKDMAKRGDTSRKFSLVSEKHSEHEATESDKSRSPSIAGEKLDGKLSFDRSRSASIAGDRYSEKDVTEPIHKSRSPSVLSEQQDEIPFIERSRSPSFADVKYSDDCIDTPKIIRSSKLVCGYIPSEQEAYDTKELVKKSTSPSIASEISDVEGLVEHYHKSPGFSGEKHIRKDGTVVIEKSRSSSTIADDCDRKEPTNDSIFDGKPIKTDTTKSLEIFILPGITNVIHDSHGQIDSVKSSASLDDIITDTDIPDVTSKIGAPDESLNRAKAMGSDKVTVYQTEKEVIISSSPVVERTSRSTGNQNDTFKRDDDDDENDNDKKYVDKPLTDELRSTGILSGHVSELDERDAVEVSLKIAETMADKSVKARHVTKPLLDETDPCETLKDRSRSHSVYDTGEKTPLGRSRTASLFEDREPEVLSSRSETMTAYQDPGDTYSYNESDETKFTKDDLSRMLSLKDVPDDKKESISSDSRKYSLTKCEDAISKGSSVAIHEDIAGQLIDDYHTTTNEISKVEEYIVNKYIIKKETITSQVVEEIVMIYSMPKFIILKLIEAIIIKKNVPRDFIVDYPKYDENCDSAVTLKNDHVEMIVIPPEKRHDIESYIQDEFIKKNKQISSKILDDLVTLKSVSRHIIIMIIEEIITKRKLQRAELVEDGVLDDCSKLSETDIGGVGRVDRLIHEENLPSVSTDFNISSQPLISSSDMRLEEESGISEQKRVQIESYVMEECVKKGKKITLSVLEQIIRNMSVSRSVLMDIIENIIVTRKMSRKTMVDDAIYGDADTLSSKAPEYLPMKDQIVELSGKSTPDPKSSGYSTPETRQYDEKYSKEMSSYTTDYESPFHKAFVGGMTEIRTTHITTLSGKSTPDFGARGETPESLSDSMTSSSQTKAEEKVSSNEEPPHTLAKELNETVEQTSLISTEWVAMTTASTTASSALGSVPEQKDYRIPVASAIAASVQELPDDLSKRMKRDTVNIESKSQLGDMSDMTKIVPRDTFVEEVVKEEEPQIMTKVIRKEVASEERPEIITQEIRREFTGDGEEEPEVITRVIRRQATGEGDEEGESEIINRVIRREIIDQDDDFGNDYQHRTISRRISNQEGSGDMIETITTKTITAIVTKDMPRHEEPELQTTAEQIVPESGSTYVTRIAMQDSLAGGPISADVKRTITTVTTVTEPDGKVTTKKDVQESTDTLEGEELLEKLIDSTKTEDSDRLPDAKSIESLKTEKIITETIKTVASASGLSTFGIRGDIDSDKSTHDNVSRDEKCDLSKSKLEKIVAESVDLPISPIIKDLISEERGYSEKSSPEMSLSKDNQLGNWTGKSTPDIPSAPFVRDSGSAAPSGTLVQTSGRSTPDKRADSRSSTATPESFRSSEVIRTTITTTRTMSEDGDIITTTKEITETTNEKGEVTILTEKTDVTVEDRVLPKDAGESSPKSDHSNIHGRTGTHVWGSNEERQTYSDDEAPGSPLSTTSQVGYSPQTTYHFGEQSFGKDSLDKSVEFSEADMSSSFYGELPELPPRVTTLKTAYLESSSGENSGTSGPAPTEGDFSLKKFTVEKGFAGVYSETSSGKRYVDDADLDFEKVLLERKEMKKDRGDHSRISASGYADGNLTKPSSSSSSEKTTDPKNDAKKDPLADWGTPLGLPSPKPPRKFNLRTTARSADSADISPDSLNFDAINDWGEPLRLPSPAPVADEASNKGTPTTPKKERKQPKKVISENMKNRKRSESPSKNEKKTKDAKNKVQPVYMDLTYVPHHGNSYYTSLEFFKRVRARYYVFSGTEPSREVYDALLDAKKSWEDKDLEVTMIPTYDTDTLGYWVADNEEALAANHIDLSPSASRCTINLQDHETSCSAYRLEF